MWSEGVRALGVVHGSYILHRPLNGGLELFPFWATNYYLPIVLEVLKGQPNIIGSLEAPWDNLLGGSRRSR